MSRNVKAALDKLPDAIIFPAPKLIATPNKVAMKKSFAAKSAAGTSYSVKGW